MKFSSQSCFLRKRWKLLNLFFCFNVLQKGVVRQLFVNSTNTLMLSIRWKHFSIVDTCTNLTPKKLLHNNSLIWYSGNYQCCTFPLNCALIQCVRHYVLLFSEANEIMAVHTLHLLTRHLLNSAHICPLDISRQIMWLCIWADDIFCTVSNARSLH